MPTLAELYPAYQLRSPSLGALGQTGTFGGLPMGALATLLSQRGDTGAVGQPALAGFSQPAAVSPTATAATTTGTPTDYLAAIRHFEGFRERPYWDVRQWTSGYGTRAAHPGETIDRAEAERRLQAEWASALAQVRGIGVPLTPGREAALASLTLRQFPWS
jgi:hypothetical protein